MPFGRKRQHRPERDRIAERMEKRQNAQQHVAVAQVDDLVDGLDVRADVVLRQHHALGRPVEPEVKITVSKSSGLMSVKPKMAFQQRNRHQPCRGGRNNLVGQRDLVRKILEQHELGVDFEIELFQHPPAGQARGECRTVLMQEFITSELAV